MYIHMYVCMYISMQVCIQFVAFKANLALVLMAFECCTHTQIGEYVLYMPTVLRVLIYT